MEFKKGDNSIASRKEILDTVEVALRELTNEFIRNPMRFFSEKDFHWYFCYLLNTNELVKTRFDGYKTMICTKNLPKHIKNDCDTLKSSGARNRYIAIYYRDQTGRVEKFRRVR